MSTKWKMALLTPLFAALTLACGGDDAPGTQESPTAFPGMQGGTEPTMGVGATEAPDVTD